MCYFEELSLVHLTANQGRDAPVYNQLNIQVDQVLNSSDSRFAQARSSTGFLQALHSTSLEKFLRNKRDIDIHLRLDAARLFTCAFGSDESTKREEQMVSKGQFHNIHEFFRVPGTEKGFNKLEQFLLPDTVPMNHA